MAGQPGTESFAEYPGSDGDTDGELVAAVCGHQLAQQDELAGKPKAADCDEKECGAGGEGWGARDEGRAVAEHGR